MSVLFSSAAEISSRVRKREMYGLPLKRPLPLVLAPEVKERPPPPPPDRNPVKTIWWSLKMRYWAETAETRGPMVSRKGKFHGLRMRTTPFGSWRI